MSQDSKFVLPLGSPPRPSRLLRGSDALAGSSGQGATVIDRNYLLSFHLGPPCALSGSDPGETGSGDPVTARGYGSTSAQRGYGSVEALEFGRETVTFLFQLSKYEGKIGHEEF